MNEKTLQACLDGAFEGTTTFGETVGRMMEEGVEWYSANLVLGMSTHYAADGEHHRTDWPKQKLMIADAFDQERVVASIRSAQKREIIYPEFLKRIAAAGVVYYTVHMRGRRAIYFGRHGEFYIEPFPTAMRV